MPWARGRGVGDVAVHAILAYADLFDDDLDDAADRRDALRAASRGRVADLLRTETPSESSPEPPAEVSPQVTGVETRGIEPLTPALQRRCSAN